VPRATGEIAKVPAKPEHNSALIIVRDIKTSLGMAITSPKETE
jgi:hypothetical protein